MITTYEFCRLASLGLCLGLSMGGLVSLVRLICRTFLITFSGSTKGVL